MDYKNEREFDKEKENYENLKRNEKDDTILAGVLAAAAAGVGTLLVKLLKKK